jgi:hypothetical protein
MQESSIRSANTGTAEIVGRRRLTLAAAIGFLLCASAARGRRSRSRLRIFFDPNTQTAYPAVNTVHSWGTSNVADWTIVDDVHLKSITAYRDYWGDLSDDQDNSPMGIAWAYNLLDHHQFTQEFQLTGTAFDSKLNWAAGLFYFDGYSLNRGHINLNFLAGFFPPGFPFFGQPVLAFNQNDPAKNELHCRQSRVQRHRRGHFEVEGQRGRAV